MSGDGTNPKGKKRSSLERVNENDIAEYLNKKAQEKAVKVGTEVQPQLLSSNFNKINPWGKKVIPHEVPGYIIDLDPPGDPNLNDNHRHDLERSESSANRSNHVHKKKRITDYWTKKVQKMVTEIVKEVKSEMVPGYFNDISPLGHSNCNEKELSCPRHDSYSKDDEGKADIAVQAQEKIHQVIKLEEDSFGHSEDFNSLGGCNLKGRRERSCDSSSLRKDNDRSDDGNECAGNEKRLSSKTLTEETPAEKDQEKVMKEPGQVQSESIHGDSDECNPLDRSGNNDQQSNFMSSAAFNSHFSSSHPRAQQAKRKKIIVLDDGSVVGDNALAWNTRTGYHVRDHIPVSYLDWRQVPQSPKDKVWKALMGEFELDVPPEVARPLLERWWPGKFRTFKKVLRGILKSDGPLANAPKGVKTDVWKKFVENESDPQKQEFNAKMAVNRQKLTYSHCLGRRTYAQKQYLMEKDQPEKQVGRVDKWLAAHERRDGSVLPSAKLIYDEIKAAQDRRKNANGTGEGCSNPFLEHENDAVAEVFGKEAHGRIRGISPLVHKKQLIHIGVAKARVEQIKKTHVEVQQNKKANEDATSIKNDLSKVTSRLDKFEGLLETMLSKLPNGNATMGASHSLHHNRPPVILLDKFGKELAKGYVVTDNAAGECPH